MKTHMRPPRKSPRKEKVIINTGSEDDGQQLGEGPATRLQPEKDPRSTQPFPKGSPEIIFRRKPEFYLSRMVMKTHMQPPRKSPRKENPIRGAPGPTPSIGTFVTSTIIGAPAGSPTTSPRSATMSDIH